MKKLLYVSDCFVNSTVFESQVHTICNEHSTDLDITLLALCNASEIKKDGLKNSNYKLVKYKKPPKLFVPFMQKVAMLTFKNLHLFKDADIIHCRGHIGTAFAINICKKYNLKKPIIGDIRGAVPEEILFKEGFAYKYFSYQAKQLEKFIFKNTDYFFFVSENMKTYYFNHYKFQTKNCSIFPTIVNEKYFYISKENRLTVKTNLGIVDKFVYIYVGGIDKWQNLDKVITSFAKKSENNKELFLLVITTEPDYVKKLIKELGVNIKNIFITTSKYEEVANYLNASDAGLIIRDKNIVNYVASPTKVNEYLACGLKIIDKLDEIGNKLYEKENMNYIPLKRIINKQNKIYQELGDR